MCIVCNKIEERANVFRNGKSVVAVESWQGNGEEEQVSRNERIEAGVIAQEYTVRWVKSAPLWLVNLPDTRLSDAVSVRLCNKEDVTRKACNVIRY